MVAGFLVVTQMRRERQRGREGGGREREGETDTDRETHTHTQTGRQADRQTDNKPGRQTNQ